MPTVALSRVAARMVESGPDGGNLAPMRGSAWKRCLTRVHRLPRAPPTGRQKCWPARGYGQWPWTARPPAAHGAPTAPGSTSSASPSTAGPLLDHLEVDVKAQRDQPLHRAPESPGPRRCRGDLGALQLAEGDRHRQDLSRDRLRRHPASPARTPPRRTWPAWSASTGPSRHTTIRDTAFGEDASTSRTGSGPANMATIRAAVIAAVKDARLPAHPPKAGATTPPPQKPSAATASMRTETDIH
jgi:hypothetical protein